MPHEKLDIEAVEAKVADGGDNLETYLEGLIERFPDCGYLHVLLFEDRKDFTVLHRLINNTKKTRLDEHELLPFCFAVMELDREGSLDRTVVDPILSLNFEQIKAVFSKEKFPVLYPVDAEGRPPPPRPKSLQPHVKPVTTMERREPKRALPGYTPGWMAAEYAKKHRL